MVDDIWQNRYKVIERKSNNKWWLLILNVDEWYDDKRGDDVDDDKGESLSSSLYQVLLKKIITTKSYPIKWGRLHRSTSTIIFYSRPCFYLNC